MPTTTSPARAAARPACTSSPPRPRQAAGTSPQVWESARRSRRSTGILALESRYGPGGPPGDATVSRPRARGRRLFSARLEGRPDPRRGLHVRRPTARGRGPWSTSSSPDAAQAGLGAVTRAPAWRPPLGVDLDDTGQRRPWTVSKAACRALVEGTSPLGSGSCLSKSRASRWSSRTPGRAHNPQCREAHDPRPRAHPSHPMSAPHCVDCSGLVPASARHDSRGDISLSAPRGGFVPPGPSGAPSRGMGARAADGAELLTRSTRRPSPRPLAMGRRAGAAEKLCQRHLAEEGRYPRSVGHRGVGDGCDETGGDDIAEMLALLSSSPLSAEFGAASMGSRSSPSTSSGGRGWSDVAGSGFFPGCLPPRDRPRAKQSSFRRRSPRTSPRGPTRAALTAGGSRASSGRRRARTAPASPGHRVPATGKIDDDLAAIYLAWSGWSYGRGAMGAPAGEGLAGGSRRRRSPSRTRTTGSTTSFGLRRLPAGPRWPRGGRSARCGAGWAPEGSLRGLLDPGRAGALTRREAARSCGHGLLTRNG